MFDTEIMSTLRSALEEHRSVELRYCSDGEVEADLAELRRAAGVIEAECARRVADVERRRSFAREGHLSVTSWVEDRFHTTWSDAARQVRVARALEHMPATWEALADGEVSVAAVGQLVAARAAAPEEFPRVEEILTTGWSTRGSACRWSTDGPASPVRTAPRSRTGRRRSIQEARIPTWGRALRNDSDDAPPRGPSTKPQP